jgi:hypothetical protein
VMRMVATFISWNDITALSAVCSSTHSTTNRLRIAYPGVIWSIGPHARIQSQHRRWVHTAHATDPTIDFSTWPSIRKLLISGSYSNVRNVPWTTVLPDTITWVSFGESLRCFESASPGFGDGREVARYPSYTFCLSQIPRTVTHLGTGVTFTKPIGVGDLPGGLIHLVLGAGFDFPLITGAMPVTMIHLDLGPRFDHPIQRHHLPPNLESLRIGWCYSTPLLPHSFPDSLKTLVYMGRHARLWVPGCIPPAVESLTIVANAIAGPTPIKNLFPPTLTDLTIHEFQLDRFGLNCIPPSVRTLALFMLQDPAGCAIAEGLLPPGLVCLSLLGEYDGMITNHHLPAGLLSITFGQNFHRHLFPGDLPQSIRHVKFLRPDRPRIRKRTLPADLATLSFCEEGRNQRCLTRGDDPYVVHLFGAHVVPPQTSVCIMVPVE